ncbi:hypothetical protein JTB14_028671 [Gonioctena quinquepunctata]|nr:hypothetical protein JTB14_028671 [Gonioctena quinquepunctata]
MDTGSSLQETESPEHDAALLKSGIYEETIGSSKALTIGRISIGDVRKRFKYLIKQGLPAEDARVKSVEPVKKESTSDKGLKKIKSETKTPDGQPKKKSESSRKRQQFLNAYSGIPTWKPEVLHGENPWIDRGSNRKPQRNELEGSEETIRRPTGTPNALG